MTISEQSEFKDTPEGWYDYWQKEMNRSEDNLKSFKKRGDKCVEKFLDKRDDESSTRLNLYHSNIRTLRAFLFGNSPKTDVARRSKDQNDDVARVAAEILARMINNDVEESGNDFTSVLQGALDDRLIPGLGVARVRYVVQMGNREVDPYENPENPGEMISTEEYMQSEEASVDYIHWRDVRWGYTRTWKDLPWMAFRTYLTKDEAVARFGDVIAGALEYKEVGPGEKGDSTFGDAKDAWQKAEIWEICSKKHQKYFWWSNGAKVILDAKPDILKLKGFWPTPKWMMANTTTTVMEPVPDYYFSQDLYADIDELMHRIAILTDAIRAIGVYDESFPPIQRMLEEGGENGLIPVKDWQRFAEKGGLEGVIDWMPIEAIVDAVDKLRALLQDKIQLLYQQTGLSDIMRGQASENRVSAAEQKLKARFGSIQIQAMQDQFARFASELAALKAEVICKHFSPQTILEQSGIMNTPDAEMAPHAVQLLKQFDKADWRVAIKPETVAMTDYAQLQSERTEYLNSLGLFMQSAAPLYELAPATGPVLLELLKWGLAGFKGSQQIEGVLDRAIAAVSSAPPPQKDDGDKAKVEAEQVKLEGIKLKGEVEREALQMKRVVNREEVKNKQQKNKSDAQLTALKTYAQLATAKAQAENAQVDSKP